MNDKKDVLDGLLWLNIDWYAFAGNVFFKLLSVILTFQSMTLKTYQFVADCRKYLRKFWFNFIKWFRIYGVRKISMVVCA